MRKIIALFVALAALLLITPAASAHEKWFAEPTASPIDPNLILSPQTFIALAVAAAAVLLVTVLQRPLSRAVPLVGGAPLDSIPAERLRLIYGWLPLILAVHFAAPLLVNGVSFHLFAPNLDLPQNLLFVGGLLSLGEIVVALGFLYGALTRYVAVLLAVLFALGMFIFNPLYILEHAEFLGAAAFFFIAGRGLFSVDSLVGLARADDSRLPLAVPLLRIGVGIGIVVLAFTEKLWNPAMAHAFLENKPFFNFLPGLGLGNLGEDFFINAAGVVEFTFGVLLIYGRLLRPIIVLLWLPFNLTLPYLGWQELVGHLPIYGTMLVLLFFGDAQPITTPLRPNQNIRRDKMAQIIFNTSQPNSA